MKRQSKLDKSVIDTINEPAILNKNFNNFSLEEFSNFPRRNTLSAMPAVKEKNSNIKLTSLANSNVNINPVSSHQENVEDTNSNKKIFYPPIFLNNYELLIYLFTESACISHDVAYDLLEEFLDYNRFKDLFKYKKFKILDVNSRLFKKIQKSNELETKKISFINGETSAITSSSKNILKGEISNFKLSEINNEENKTNDYKNQKIVISNLNALNQKKEKDDISDEYNTDNSFIKKEYSEFRNKLKYNSAIKLRENYTFMKQNLNKIYNKNEENEIYKSYKTYIYLPLMVKYLKIILLKQKEEKEIITGLSDHRLGVLIDKNKKEFIKLLKTFYYQIKAKNKKFLNDYYLIVNFLTKLQEYIFEDIIKNINLKENENVKFVKSKIFLAKLLHSLKKRKKEDKELLSIIVERKPIYEKLSNVLISLMTKRSRTFYLQEFLAGSEKQTDLKIKIKDNSKRFDKVISISDKSKTAISSDFRQKYSIKKGNRISKGVILPYSYMRLVWDMIVIICVVNNVIIIPISFLWKNYDGIYLSVTDISDMIIDGVTYLDIVFSFRTGYVDASNNIVTDLREIKLNYLKTWFFIDICSTFPWEVLMFGRNTQMLNLFKIPRVLRVNRLIKITEKFNKALVRLILLVIIFFLFAHWTGCLCFALLEYYFVLENMPKPEQKFCMTTNLLGEDDYKESCKYFFSLFNGMSILNVQSVSFPEDNAAKNSALIFTFLLGQIAFSIIVGLMTSSAKYLDKYGTLYNERLLLIHNQLEFHNVKDPLKKHVTLYFDYLWKKHKETYIKSTSLHHINPILRQKIHLQMYRNLMPKLEFINFTECDDFILGDFLNNLKITVVLPYEIVFHEGTVSKGLYILDHGCVKIDCKAVNESCDIVDKRDNFNDNSKKLEKLNKSKFSFKYLDIKKNKNSNNIIANNSNRIISNKEYIEDNISPLQIFFPNLNLEKFSSNHMNIDYVDKNKVDSSNIKSIKDITEKSEKINITNNNQILAQDMIFTTTQIQPLILNSQNKNKFPNTININNPTDNYNLDQSYNTILNTHKNKLIKPKIKPIKSGQEKKEAICYESKDMKPYFDIVALMTKNSRHWCTAYSTEFTELAYIKNKSFMTIMKRNEKIFNFLLNEAKALESNNNLFENDLIYNNISTVSSRTSWKIYKKCVLEKSEIWLDKEDMYLDEQHDSYDEDKIKADNQKVERYLHQLTDAIDEKVNDELKQKFLYNYRKSRLSQRINTFNSLKFSDKIDNYRNSIIGSSINVSNINEQNNSSDSNSSSSKKSESSKSNKSSGRASNWTSTKQALSLMNSKFERRRNFKRKTVKSIIFSHGSESSSGSMSEESSISNNVKSNRSNSDQKSKSNNSKKSLPSIFKDPNKILKDGE